MRHVHHDIDLAIHRAERPTLPVPSERCQDTRHGVCRSYGMANKHTPTIELEAARRELEAAREACPHWDFEPEGDAQDDCCYRVDDAKHRYRAAKRAVERAGL